jgi:hypothetical protein
MPTIRITLDVARFNRLAEIAVEERRPIPWQAEVLLLQVIDQWPVPPPPMLTQETAACSRPKHPNI